MYSGRGVLLVELSIGVGILALFLLIALPFSSRVTQSFQINLDEWCSAQLLWRARMMALSTHNDVIIRYQDGRLVVLLNEEEQWSEPLSRFTKASINGSGKLGFTYKGRTKYAGTLTLHEDILSKRVRVGVGFGKVNVD